MEAEITFQILPNRDPGLVTVLVINGTFAGSLLLTKEAWENLHGGLKFQDHVVIEDLR